MGQTQTKAVDKVFDLISAGNGAIDVDVFKSIVHKLSKLDNVNLNVHMLAALDRDYVTSKMSMSHKHF